MQEGCRVEGKGKEILTVLWCVTGAVRELSCQEKDWPRCPWGSADGDREGG